MATRKKRAKKKVTRKGSKRRARRATVDLSTLGYEQLRAVVQEATERAHGMRDERAAQLREKWLAEAREIGFSAEEILGSGARRKKTTTKKRAAKKRGRKKKTRSGSAAKYANPADPSQTWSGRGRRPKWAEAHLKKGGKLDDLSISS